MCCLVLVAGIIGPRVAVLVWWILKRSTLGSYALGVLDDEWTDYVRFHLDTAGCEYCAAHLADINAEAGGISPSARERIFASSAGFLRR